MKGIVNEWYQASKVRLDKPEARHVASFKIIYPTVFGYVKEGTLTSKHHLPAIKTFKDWNSSFSMWMAFRMHKTLQMICTQSLKSLLLKWPTDGWMCFTKSYLQPVSH